MRKQLVVGVGCGDIVPGHLKDGYGMSSVKCADLSISWFNIWLRISITRSNIFWDFSMNTHCSPTAKSKHQPILLTE